MAFKQWINVIFYSGSVCILNLLHPLNNVSVHQIEMINMNTIKYIEVTKVCPRSIGPHFLNKVLYIYLCA